jgi:predicted O-methyltransferase YrrM
LDDELPWITFPAIQFLKRIIQPEMKIFEYGIGGSTLFFAKRVKEVISVEHDPEWIVQVSTIINRYGFKNWNVFLKEPTFIHSPFQADPSDPDAYASNDEKFVQKSFKEYASTIDKYPDSFFDIVLIDGRVRPSCYKHAYRKIKNNGFLILDNSERPYYAYIHNSLKNLGWKLFEFNGPGNYVLDFWQTCFWQKV